MFCFSFCFLTLWSQSLKNKMKNRFFITLIGILFSIRLSANGDINALLRELDNTIARRQTYIEKKEKELSQLQTRLRQAHTEEQRYRIRLELYDGYRLFNADSTLHIVRALHETATRTSKKEYILNARLSMAETLGVAGMFTEALDILKDLPPRALPECLLPYYYHVCRTIYGYMGDYAVTPSQKQLYNKLTDVYRDSILIVNDPESMVYQIVKADQYNVHGEWDKAIRMLEEYAKTHRLQIHDEAMLMFTLSESYKLKGDEENRKRCLLVSSINDLKSPIREYSALRELAVMLYRDGDIDRAYTCIKLCMEDASICNARLRIVEVLDLFPVINDTYQQEKEAQQKKLKVMLCIILALSLCLSAGIYYMYKQMKRLALARRQVVEANDKLKQVNSDLHQSNTKLQESNHSLAENINLKEVYIGRYMDQCSTYIDKMDEYRKSLGKMAAAGKLDELFMKLKSTQYTDDQLKDFYENFDETFLQLFPNFVEEFNKLLIETEQIHLKNPERLNTELRIFALVRLGITDSIKIAQFLRYSVTTIYNYRTKARNKAKGNRDEFEKNVMKIGYN